MQVTVTTNNPASGRATGRSERDKRIRTAQQRAVKIMQSRSDKARSTTATTATVGEGLACEIRQGRFTAVADLGPGMGGDSAGPSPSFYGRAAIAGCIAMAVKMLAATEGRRFKEVEATVETDFDDLALFGLGPSSAAPLETRISIRIASGEAQDVIESIVDTALRRDPWFLALRDAQTVVTSIELRGSVARNS